MRLAVCLLFLCGVLYAQRYATLDGYGNNKEYPTWCTAGAPLQVDFYSSYFTPNSSSLPSARTISNEIFSRVFRRESKLSQLHAAFGQFIEYDIIKLVNDQQGEYDPIQVPTGDPYFDPDNKGNQELAYFRHFFTQSMDTVESVRKPINFVSGVLDGSLIYGSTPEELLKVKSGAYLNLVESNIDGERILLSDSLTSDFIAADSRTSENILLTALITLFTREHNSLVDILRQSNKDLGEEELFLEARRYLIAEIHAITFNEYFPSLLGQVLPEYREYDEDLNAQPSNIQAAAWRQRDTVIRGTVEWRDPSDSETYQIDTRDGQYYSGWIQQLGIAGFLSSAASRAQYATSAQLVSDLRNYYVDKQNSITNNERLSDLIALDIQMARDSNVPSYNDVRQLYGLDRKLSFNEVTNDNGLANTLTSLYGSPDLADFFVVALCEESGNGNLGELLSVILYDHAVQLRNGDYYYYENRELGWSSDSIDRLSQTTLADIILRNTNLDGIPCGVFTTLGSSPDITELCGRETTVEAYQRQEEQTITVMNGLMSLSWTNMGDSIRFLLTGRTRGWLGFALASEPGHMLNADAVIGAHRENGNSYIDDFFISESYAVDCPGVCPDVNQGGDNDLRNTLIVELSSGYTVLRWSRKLDTNDKTDLEIKKGFTDVIFAMAADDQDDLAYHKQNVASARIDFFTGSSSESDDDDEDYNGTFHKFVIHGAFMYFAWVLLFPLGTIVVRYCKKFLQQWWFRMHMLIQYLGVLFIIVALIITVEATAARGNSHIHNAHAILGVISVALAIITPAIGQITSLLWSSERKSVPIFPDRTHYFFGYASPIVGYVTIFFGLYEIHAYWWFYLLAAIGVATVVLIFITFETLQRIYIYRTAQANAKANEDIPEQDEQWSDEEWSNDE